MACNPNINEILNLLFSAGNDEFNWLNNTNTPITTVDGQLKLTPESSTSQFTRTLGTLDPTNNRIRLQSNLDVYRPQSSSHTTFCAKFEVFNGSTLIDSYTLYLDELEAGQLSEYNFDRVYKYDGLSGNISLKITVTEGWQNQLFLDYLKCWDSNYCDDNVRNYFVLKEFFNDAFGSVSSAIQLLEWKVDDVETLTPAFFSENNSPGGNPVADWFMAKANIDGSNRVADVVDPNTFNPFISEWGLNFDNTNYYDGKPTGVTSGSDYGTGILQIGFEKPTILNGALENQDGAFFIDIDYTKNLKIVFNVLVNDNDSNVFNSPKIYRKYTILWNKSTCSGQFYFNDVLDNNLYYDETDNGFLSGITGQESTIETIGCDEAFAYNGTNGTFEFVINFGTEVGQCGIAYNAYSVPDKFDIEWNGITYSTGYVGLSIYDQSLLNLGVPPNKINTESPSNGTGQLLFQKTSPYPTTAVVRVSSPMEGTAWAMSGICPSGTIQTPPVVSIDTIKNDYELGENVVFNISASDPDGTISSWIVNFSDGTSQNGTGTPPATITKTFGANGSITANIIVTDNDGLTGNDSCSITVFTDASYKFSGIETADCAEGMDGVIEVFSGSIVIQNDSTSFTGVDVNIDGVVLQKGDTHVLTVGNYPYYSPPNNCANGTIITSLIVL